MEGDNVCCTITVSRNPFQSTPSAWRETIIEAITIKTDAEFQSTPSAWRETFHNVTKSAVFRISIHSLRMEGDISKNSTKNSRLTFQSTPSAWRETEREKLPQNQHAYFNPLPPHGGRLDNDLKMVDDTIRFQSTPSAWRETVSIFNFNNSGRHFNPLPPHGGRPVKSLA